MGINILEIRNEYVLVIIDYFTRKAWASVLKAKSAKMVLTTLKALFRKIGIPNMLVMDAGLEFNNGLMSEMCENMNIIKHVISTDHRKSKGRVERLHRSLREIIRKMDENIPIRKAIGLALNSYNNALHSGIKMSPDEAWNENDSEKLKFQNSDKSVYSKDFKKRNRERFIKNQIVGVAELPKKTKGIRNLVNLGKLLKNYQMIHI